MSQHKIDHNGMQAVYGYDRPLNYYFLVITCEPTDENPEGIVFSNLFLDDPAMTVDEIRETLDQHAIPAPETLDAILAADFKAANDIP